MNWKKWILWAVVLVVAYFAYRVVRLKNADKTISWKGAIKSQVPIVRGFIKDDTVIGATK